jgi:hypothetical protein
MNIGHAGAIVGRGQSAAEKEKALADVVVQWSLVIRSNLY